MKVWILQDYGIDGGRVKGVFVDEASYENFKLVETYAGGEISEHVVLIVRIAEDPT